MAEMKYYKHNKEYIRSKEHYFTRINKAGYLVHLGDIYSERIDLPNYTPISRLRFNLVATLRHIKTLVSNYILRYIKLY